MCFINVNSQHFIVSYSGNWTDCSDIFFLNYYYISWVGLWTFTLISCRCADSNCVFQTDLFMRLSRGKNAVIRHLGGTLLQQLLASTSLSTVPKPKSGWLGDGGQGGSCWVCFWIWLSSCEGLQPASSHLPWKTKKGRVKGNPQWQISSSDTLVFLPPSLV